MTTKFLPFLLATVLLVGCSSESTKPPRPTQEKAVLQTEQASIPTTKTDETYTHVITTDTEYYVNGPAQARPPEGKLKAGTKVNVIKEAGSYCKVESENRVEGYVVADSVKMVKSK